MNIKEAGSISSEEFERVTKEIMKEYVDEYPFSGPIAPDTDFATFLRSGCKRLSEEQPNIVKNLL